MTNLEKQLQVKTKKVEELNIEVSTLARDYSSQSQNLAEAERNVNVQKEQNRLLSLRAQSFEYKAKKYDEMATQVGDIIINAQQGASEILGRASEEAKEIRSNAVVVTKQATQELSALKTDIVAIRLSMSELVTNFNKRLDTIDGAIDSVVAHEKPKELPIKEQAPTEFFRNAAKAE